MYHCLNLSSKEPGSAILIRALEPVHGLDIMHKLRNQFNTKRPRKTLTSQSDSDSQRIEEIITRSSKRIIPSSNQLEKTKVRKILKNKKPLPESLSSTCEPNKKRCLKKEELCNGPSKLCISMDIAINSLNKHHISQNEQLWLQDLDKINYTVVSSTRIGK